MVDLGVAKKVKSLNRSDLWLIAGEVPRICVFEEVKFALISRIIFSKTTCYYMDFFVQFKKYRPQIWGLYVLRRLNPVWED